MPIHGISDKRRLSRVGKVRLGIKKENAKGVQYPSAVDYFVCNEDQSTTEMAAMMFNRAYPDEPKAIDIVFPSDDSGEFFPQWYKRYGSSKGLVCKGDGELATRLNEETGEMDEIECTPECEYLAKKHCRAVASLQFMIPHVSGLGVWQIDTGSYNSIVNLNSAIDMVKTLTGGKIAFIPLKLVIRPREVQPNGKKKTVHVLDIAMEELDLKKVLGAAKDPSSALALPAYEDEKPEELYPYSKSEVVDAETIELPENNKRQNSSGDDNEPAPAKWRSKIFALGHELGEKPDEVKKIAYKRYEIDSMTKMTKSQAGDFIKFLENGMGDENMPEVMSEEVPLDLGEGDPGFSEIPF